MGAKSRAKAVVGLGLAGVLAVGGSSGTRIGVRAKIRIGEEATRRCSVGRGIAVAGPPTKQRARILKSCSSCRASRDH
jgi:hypothetical protein